MVKIEQCGTGFLKFKLGDYWGVMNYTGTTIIPTSRGYTHIGDYVALGIVALIFWLLGFILLSEKTPEPKGDGKWKRIKVKKDTTIHVMEEAE